MCGSVQSCIYGAADERVVTHFFSNAKQKLITCAWRFGQQMTCSTAESQQRRTHHHFGKHTSSSAVTLNFILH